MFSRLTMVLGTALLVAVAATPLVRLLAIRAGFIDQPDDRKHHQQATPLLGGLAIYLAVLIALFVYPERHTILGLGSILVAGSWISFLGVWDDRSGLRVSIKLTAQTLAALLLVATGVEVLLPLPAWLNLALTLLWLVGITNAFNLLDNMDGLSGGLGAIAAAFFLLLAVDNGQFLVAPLAAAIVGACAGFLIYNFNPARIFMGDSGSLFLGFLLAAVGIKLRFPQNIPQVTLWVPVLVLWVPILDTTLVTVSRLRRGQNPFLNPGRDHLSHRLVSMGCTQRQAVVILYGIATGLGLLALWVSRAGIAVAWTTGCLVLLASLLSIVVLDRRRHG